LLAYIRFVWRESRLQLFPRIAKNIGGEGLWTAADKTSPHLGIKTSWWTDRAAEIGTRILKLIK
jgi:hypothetical protein